MIYFRFVNIMTPKSVQRIGESLDVQGTGFNSRPRLNSSVLPSTQIDRIDKLSSNSLGNTDSSYWGKAAGVWSSLHPQVLHRGADKGATPLLPHIPSCCGHEWSSNTTLLSYRTWPHS